MLGSSPAENVQHTVCLQLGDFYWTKTFLFLVLATLVQILQHLLLFEPRSLLMIVTQLQIFTLVKLLVHLRWSLLNSMFCFGLLAKCLF